MIQGNPMCTEDELGLFGKFGLKYNYSKVPYASIFPDQSTLITYKDLDAACAEIANSAGKTPTLTGVRHPEYLCQLPRARGF